jgi:hypothetical protein
MRWREEKEGKEYLRDGRDLEMEGLVELCLSVWDSDKQDPSSPLVRRERGKAFISTFLDTLEQRGE